MAALALLVLVLVVLPAQALADAIVRFVHAVPGVGPAVLSVSASGQSARIGRASFGTATPYQDVPAGAFDWRLRAGDTGSLIGRGSATVRDRAYTIIALAKGSGFSMGVYTDRAARAGTALVRLVHAAPELGSPDLRLSGKVVARDVHFRQSTPYLSVAPGTYTLSATPAGSRRPVVVRGGVRLRAGQAVTGVVVGSRGQAVRIVLLSDRGVKAARTPAPALARRGTVTVRRGDSLWAIARRSLGAGASNTEIAREVQRIWDRNADRIGTGDPDLIFPGQRIELP